MEEKAVASEEAWEMLEAEEEKQEGKEDEEDPGKGDEKQAIGIIRSRESSISKLGEVRRLRAETKGQFLAGGSFCKGFLLVSLEEGFGVKCRWVVGGVAFLWKTKGKRGRGWGGWGVGVGTGKGTGKSTRKLC